MMSEKTGELCIPIGSRARLVRVIQCACRATHPGSDRSHYQGVRSTIALREACALAGEVETRASALAAEAVAACRRYPGPEPEGKAAAWHKVRDAVGALVARLEEE